MKALSRVVLSVLCLLLCAGLVAPGTLKLEIRGGLVTLEARDVPIRDILAEWARVGQTRIENREQVGGEPVTLTLRGVPEREALDILLRSVTGYVAAPRPTPVADASVYEVIYVLAAARPASQMAVGSTGARPQLLRAGPGQAMPGFVGPQLGQGPESMSSMSDDVALPVMPPGFAGEQVAFPGAVGGVQVPGQVPAPAAVPRDISMPPPPASPYVSSPGMSPGQDAKPVGTATPGMPTPAPRQPYVPGGGMTQPTQPTTSPVIKPPDTSATAPPSTMIKPPGAPD